MAIAVSSRFLALTFCVVIGLIIMLCNFHVVLAQEECKGTRVPDLLSNCQKFIEPSGPKMQPSPECCSAVKAADVPCLCKYVNRDIEKMFSMEKAVYVCRTCGKDLPAGMQCGSYKVPPLMA